VQVHREALGGRTRPCAPADCELCGGCEKPHRHGGYWRNAGPTGEGKARVERFLCKRCGLSIGVIPAGMLPYRSVAVARLEEWLDRRHGVEPAAVAGGGARPPPACEVEHGCLERSEKKLLPRIPVLRGLLGQRLPVLADGDLGGFWRALRKLGRLGEILVHLAAKFKTSLLADYRMAPDWPRARAPG
jgi:hypothetical protein